MKDLVENRSRLTLGKKLKLGAEVVRQNGLVWTTCLGSYYLASAVADRAFAAMDTLRRRRNLPGLNSASLNKLIWEAWDWQAGGEEWTPSPQWKQSVIDRILRVHMPSGGTIVEIGPGGGRWTDELRHIAARLIAVDISSECLRVCGERFAGADHIEYVLTSGSDLPGIGDATVDAVWSFDVFVHINRPEVERYAREFARVLKPGGIGVLHHGTTGGATGGWRSNLTAQTLVETLQSAGLEIVDQFTSWTDAGHEHQAGLYQDAITIFRQPAG